MPDFQSDDVIAAIMAGNDVAMQWYALTHDQPLPDTQGGVFISPSSMRIGASSQTLVLLVLGGLALYLVLKR